jgi:hypothetical protein
LFDYPIFKVQLDVAVLSIQGWNVQVVGKVPTTCCLR